MAADAGASADELAAISHHKDRKSLKRYAKGSIPERTSGQFKIQRALQDLSNTSVVAGTFIGDETSGSAAGTKRIITSLASETVVTESKENNKPVCTPAQPEGQPFQAVRSSSGNVYNFVFH